jgi:hypothetical protein
VSIVDVLDDSFVDGSIDGGSVPVVGVDVGRRVGVNDGSVGLVAGAGD